ncbi:MAG: GNAT family N-acetyltransferase [Bacteriovoracia bacterium]
MSRSDLHIATSRLDIRNWRSRDAEAFFALVQDEGFHAHAITVYRQTDLASSRRWVDDAVATYDATGLGKWAIWERETHQLVGMGGLTEWTIGEESLIDLTYRFRTSAWGKGYGTESASAMAHFAFNQLGLSQITATITPANLASKRVASRLGMKLDRRITLKGVETDLYRLVSSSTVS